MPVSVPLSAIAELPTTLARQISKRTYGQVAQLRVEGDVDQIVVHGSAPSYYVKQLALQAILESVAPLPGVRVTLNVKVGDR